jgi:sulfate transport system substrate-binding protein
MRTSWLNILALAAVAVSVALIVSKNIAGERSSQILNVSYDPTREFYADLNRQFLAEFEKKTGKRLAIKQSHGGSSRQAHAVADGLDADVVTLALPSDIDGLSKRGLIAGDWEKRLPFDARPYTSTIVFVVRKGNPKGISDWPDLVKSGVSIVTPDPKTSGNGKLSVLAAWGATVYRGGSREEAQGYLKRLFEHVPVLDSGARGAAETFVSGKIGDVHLTWENEALREADESKGELEIVYPPVSIRAEPVVAVVDKNAGRAGTADYAKAYLEFLFTDAGQETAAKHGYRPVRPEILQRYAGKFPSIDLFPISLIGKDWLDAQQQFFSDNGIFDVLRGQKHNS